MMRGHEPILAMRLRGQRPAFVCLDDHSTETDWHQWADAVPTVCVAGDVIDLLDLRFLVGMRVSIAGSTAARAKALLEAVKRAGAIAVGACALDWSTDRFDPEGFVEIWHKEAVHG